MKNETDLNINNFCFEYKQLNRIQYKCLILNKNNGAKFSIYINSQNQPPNDWLFNLYKSNFKDFILEIDSEIIKENKIAGEINNAQNFNV